MLFSIVVPVYNVEKYISICIDSIVRQTYSNWELLLIDDGSTDRSYEICREYEEREERIHLYKKKNTGQADTRNIGIEYAVGDYLLFVDSDDYIATDTLQRLYDECRRWKQVDVIISEGEFQVYGNQVEERINWKAEEYSGISGRDTLIRTMRTAPNWSPCGKCYRLLYWRDHGFSFAKNRFSEDFELIDRVVLEAKRVSMIKTFYYYRRFREDSTMTKPNKKLRIDELWALKSWEQYFFERGIDKDPELLLAFRNIFSNLYCHEILANLYLFSATEKKEVLQEIKKYKFYLNYGKNKENKAIRIAVRYLGFPLTCELLGIIKRLRIKKNRNVKY